MAAFENKFEALVDKVIEQHNKINTNNLIKERDFKVIEENNGKKKLKYADVKIKPQSSEEIEYIFLVDLYNETINEYSALNNITNDEKNTKFALFQFFQKKFNMQCSNSTFPLSEKVVGNLEDKNIKVQKEICERENLFNVTFKEIHDFVTSNSDGNTGGKPKSNKKRKTNKRKKTNKRRKTNKRKRTKSKTNKRKKRTRRR